MDTKPTPIRHCAHCGLKLERKRYCDRLEDYAAFMKRQHCSRTCGNSRKELTKHGYSWRARKHLKPACEACGETRLLHAHHIDQDKTNNEPTNIQTLCKYCHDFWHSTAKRLAVNVAGRMPALLVGGTPIPTSQESRKESPIGHTASAHWVTDKSRLQRLALGSVLEALGKAPKSARAAIATATQEAGAAS